MISYSLQDCLTDDHRRPAWGASQDWRVTQLTENDRITTMEFYRLRNTNDAEGDNVIDVSSISVRGGGAGGAAAPPVGEKIVLFGQNSIIRTQFHPSLPCLKNILMEKWHLIQNQPLLREIYKDPPLISYRKGKSLKDMLVKAKL